MCEEVQRLLLFSSVAGSSAQLLYGFSEYLQGSDTDELKAVLLYEAQCEKHVSYWTCEQ